jgi:hypothetical protein
MSKFTINTKVAYSMQQLADMFNEEKVIFEAIDLLNFNIEGKSICFSGKNKPLTPMIRGTLNYIDLEPKITFSIKILNFWGWFIITFLALVFFWKSFLGKGIWQIVVPWIMNVTYYFFKRKSLIKKIYAVFEK